MKKFLLVFTLALAGFFCSENVQGSNRESEELLTLSDTVVFDLSLATYSSNGGIYYIDIPVLIYSSNTGINALDFWFNFNLNKMTYVSTVPLVSGLDPFTNYNANNLVLSNTTSGTSASFSTPLYTQILMLRFSLASSCTEIVPSDFTNPFALVNGILSSYLFVGTEGIPPFQIEQPQPYCSSDEIVFSYPYTTVNGRTIQSYEWDFGNGQTSALQSDTAVYTAEGDYPVTLTLTTVDGCVYPIQNFIPIYPSPVAAFSSSWDEPTNVVSFTNESTISSGSINLYTWDFGGSTSNLQNPNYTFPIPDYYNVTLTATSDLGCTSSITQLVTAIDIVELDYRNFNLFPNPASNIIQIESNFQSHVRIVDAAGRLLTQDFEILPNKMSTINISMLSDGIYFLECVENQSVYRERFMVQH